MDKHERFISRRQMLEMAISIGGVAVLGSSAIAQTKRMITPEAIMGPFYPVLKPLDKNADLTMLDGHKTPAAGKVVHVAGRVVNENGDPVKGAKIEIWQANTHGRYAHDSDPNTKAPLDPNFQGYAVLDTDNEGRYRFKTVKPGAYPASGDWMRPPHIHMDVMGRTDRLVTQMYFPGEPLNDKDQLFLELGSYKTAAVPSVLPSTKEMAVGETLLHWDIVLTRG
jgi:protocatechuate 3,4-dioxygenase, beta subunit